MPAFAESLRLLAIHGISTRLYTTNIEGKAARFFKPSGANEPAASPTVA